MKKTITLLTFALLVFGLNAQYVYNDFDGNQNVSFTGWPNEPTLIANPDASGINTSANVGEWVRSEEQWAHILMPLDGTIDFSTGETFYLKVWSPIACDVLFKIENASNSGIFIEISQSISTPNQWVQLEYNFVGAASDTYGKIVIFPDFATTTDNTFYIDDLEGPEFVTGPTGDPVTLPVTFDDENVNYGLTDFGGNVSEIIVDPTDAANMVAKTIKTESAQTWAGTTVGGVVGFPTSIPFAEDATTMSVKVWSPTAGTPIRLKVENSNDVTMTCETQTNTTVAADWEIIIFDFSNEAPGTAQLNLASYYNKASIFFNFDVDGATAGEQTYFWDDMEFLGAGGEKPFLALNVQDNFENDGFSTITDWKFQDPELVDLLITEDPMNASNHVADYDRSGTFEWTNAQFILDHRMDLTVRNTFKMMVYFPSTNDYTGGLTPTAAIKLQNSLLGGDAWTTQTEIKLDVTEFDTWVELTFDFSIVSDRTDYDQVVVQLGGEGHFVAGTMYFDNLVLQNPTSIFEESLLATSVYPNPVSDILYLNDSDNLISISVYSVAGQLVYQSSDNTNAIDVSDLQSGMYTLRATGINDRQYFAKFIVK